MTHPDYSALVASQREFFLSGATRPATWRKMQLEVVKALFTENHDELCDPLGKDLRRNVNDADLMDVGYCAREAEYAPKHLYTWMMPMREPMRAVFEPGHIVVRRDPLDMARIIGAWNEPFMLTFRSPVALAAGNTAVLKPSEIATACAAAAARLVPRCFDPRAVVVMEGGVPETTELLAKKWDIDWRFLQIQMWAETQSRIIGEPGNGTTRDLSALFRHCLIRSDVDGRMDRRCVTATQQATR